MKRILSTVVSSSVLAASIVTLSAVDAQAATFKVGDFSGNDDPTTVINALDSIVSDQSPWAFDVKWEWEGEEFVKEVDSNTVDALGFNVFADTFKDGDTTEAIGGTWSIANSSPFAYTTKNGTGYSLYYVDDITEGNWSVEGAAISHISVYKPGSFTPPTEEVPEPLTILGSAVALGFGAMFKRKQKDS